MTVRELEAWLQTAKSGERITYHRGYLIKDRQSDIAVKKIAELTMNAYESNIITMAQKKVKQGYASHDPVFNYMAFKL